ncbi:bifunctional adenosylcobinamide kinase/adenosylcobinamide-phosphate guanylyltransferase [Hoyosella rhizosphaerae]|uniref:bifunctional adenosylcobinamide kinase/adenosylcobinamide-phosphate guanylyltransferase n=1 Tax=Hoyosella rhizosphaerae TaxID=1755582 RepID=UPI00166C5CBC|nr:bifunctional adenosylcobinamide kinase/adenosylcobinamide-phosphate guanylyltransferase [Hoyosella rhizosphaerae]MBN4927966.1 bifunctional adenosylcobinamide kinase/adenosylcobinamide-phosphate guanylyltransferase [Hoyosella rhizosphaerae]
MRCLILGGARSGKSSFGEALIADLASSDQVPVRYIATSPHRPNDEEWADRIRRHRATRPHHWSTVETLDVADELRTSPHTPTIVDDLGTWLAAEMDVSGAWDGHRAELVGRLDDLVSSVKNFTSPLVIVTPEVGLGIVPDTRAGRMFRDDIGVLNARIAEVCEKVVLVVAGISLPLKQVPPLR